MTKLILSENKRGNMENAAAMKSQTKFMRRTIQNSEYDCLKSKAIYVVEITQSLFLYVSSEETNTNKQI